MTSEPFTWSIALADVPAAEITVSRKLTPAECAALAAHAGIEAVGSLSASAKLRQWLGGVVADVGFAADVTQACVVTLDPVNGHVEDAYTARYMSRAFIADTEAREIEVKLEEEDPPEPIDNDRFDLAPLLTENFILALNPYPRVPGAVMPADLEFPAQGGSPFAVLKNLKDKL